MALGVLQKISFFEFEFLRVFSYGFLIFLVMSPYICFGNQSSLTYQKGHILLQALL